MSKQAINLELSVDLTDLEQVQSVVNILSGFLNRQDTPTVVMQPVTEDPKEEKPKSVRKPRKTAAQKKAEAEAAKQKAEAEEAAKNEAAAKETEQNTSEAANTSEIKIEDVRALLAKKVGNNRAEIKTKLTELEAKNVTNLDKSKYSEFMDFLNNL